MTQSKPQQPSRRHHYIPEFYLKRWATNGLLTEYSRGYRGRVVARRTAPGGTAWKKDLYTIPYLEAGPGSSVESVFMAGLDTESDRIIGKIVDKDYIALTDEEKAQLARMVNGLLLRVPEEVEKLKVTMQTAFDRVSIKMQADYDRMRKPDDPPTALEYQRQNFPFLVEQWPFEVLQKLIAAQNGVKALCDLTWSVLNVSGQRVDLLTSDRPVMRLNSVGGRRTSYAMPLDPNHLLMMAGHPDDLIPGGTREILAFFNRAVTKQSVRFVYGTDEKRRSWVDRYMATHPPPSLMGDVGDLTRRLAEISDRRPYRTAK